MNRNMFLLGRFWKSPAIPQATFSVLKYAFFIERSLLKAFKSSNSLELPLTAPDRHIAFGSIYNGVMFVSNARATVAQRLWW